MKQTPEAVAFLDRVSRLPSGSVSLDDVLQPSLEDEAELRKVFATDPDNQRLRDPVVGLVDVFAAPATIRTTRQRVVKDKEELSSKYIMPLPESKRRKEGDPAMVGDLDEFLNNFKIFTEGSLLQLDWSNVIVAGGAVLACLLPVPEEYKVSKRSLRKWFHTISYPVSDVDLFIWGLNAEEGQKKLQSIYEAVRDSIPWDVTCVRTKHAISIHSQYPYRSVQVVLRLYSSPAEVLAGFDVDAPCCAYDGSRVWANPRAITAIMRQCNTIDITRRSPSYEVRLAKYSSRNFEIYVPNLRRDDIDPTIFERSIIRVEGLARLLVLEKLADPDSRTSYLDHRRRLRGRPDLVRPWQNRGRKYKGDLKADTTLDGLQMNDYDVTSLHIPYGPGWDARRIDKLVYSTDLGMNSPFNPKNKDRVLHRHPAFFGTMAECIEDCCGACPEPEGEEEEKLEEKEKDIYIRGRVEFIQQDPGRQSLSGSFNPINDGEWTAMAYIGPTERFFSAIVVGDRHTVQKMLEEGIDPNRRDHVGRSPLHVAILCRQCDIATDLINANARMTARLVDGRTSLHLAAQLGEIDIVRKLLERSALNAKESGEQRGFNTDTTDVDTDPGTETDPETDVDRPSSDDDWSSDSDDKPVKVSRKEAREAGPPEDDTTGGLPEDSEDDPDVFDLDIPDWDLAFTPLGHAIAAGSLDIVDLLLTHGSNPSIHTKAKDYESQNIHPLTLTILTENPDDASRIAARLVRAGATSSTADSDLLSIFHRILRVPNTLELVMSLLQCDPSAKLSLHYPAFSGNYAVFPLVSAIDIGDWAKIAVLIAHGHKVVIPEEDVDKALELRRQNTKSGSYSSSDPYPGNVYMPMEVGLARGDDVIHLLTALGADVNLPTHRAATYTWNENLFLSLFDWLRVAQEVLGDATKSRTPRSPSSIQDLPRPGTWKAYLQLLQDSISATNKRRDYDRENRQEYLRNKKRKTFVDEALSLLSAANAKVWNELYPDKKTGDNPGEDLWPTSQRQEKVTPGYTRKRGWSADSLPSYLATQCDELFQACWIGDDERIRQLCLPEEESSQQTLEISVQWRSDTSSYRSTGFTALQAAILGRQWDTAKLVMSIATAQYVPTEKRAKFDASTSGFDSDEDDSNDDEEYADSDSDGTIDVKFTELGGKPAKVRSSNSPATLLSDEFEWLNADGEHCSGNPLEKAIKEKDVETFVHVADLYDYVTPASLPSQTLDWIIDADQPEMLDEYIRRTGYGISLQSKEEREDEERTQAKDRDSPVKPPARSRKRVYYGLDVHGKKRKDLARRGDPDAKQSATPRTEPPLLWKAAGSCAQKIIEYLSSSRPLAAYAAYASKRNNNRARFIRRTDFTSRLPAWLGWYVNTVNESVLVAALRSSSLGDGSVIDQLFSLQPQLLSEVLDTPIKFVGSTPLMVAISAGADVGVIENLIRRGAIVTATDSAGRNVVHLAVENGNHKVLRYFLKTLPCDTTRELLLQRTKRWWKTPLHLAVDSGRHHFVEMLLKEAPEPQALDIRDVDGEMPLHTAALAGHSRIIRLLLESAASSGASIYAENATGDTALEISLQRYLLWRTRDSTYFGALRGPSELPSYNVEVDDPVQFDAAKLDERLSALRAVLDKLSQQETPMDPIMLEVFRSFIKHVEGKLAVARSHVEDDVDTTDQGCEDVELTCDEQDPVSTLQLLRAAVAARPGPRLPVHLADVQTSVKSRLAQQQREEAKRAASRRKSKSEEQDEMESDPVKKIVEQSLLGLLDEEVVEEHLCSGDL